MGPWCQCGSCTIPLIEALLTRWYIVTLVLSIEVQKEEPAWRLPALSGGEKKTKKKDSTQPVQPLRRSHFLSATPPTTELDTTACHRAPLSACDAEWARFAQPVGLACADDGGMSGGSRRTPVSALLPSPLC